MKTSDRSNIAISLGMLFPYILLITYLACWNFLTESYAWSEAVAISWGIFMWAVASTVEFPFLFEREKLERNKIIRNNKISSHILSLSGFLSVIIVDSVIIGILFLLGIRVKGKVEFEEGALLLIGLGLHSVLPRLLLSSLLKVFERFKTPKNRNHNKTAERNA